LDCGELIAAFPYCGATFSLFYLAPSAAQKVLLFGSFHCKRGVPGQLMHGGTNDVTSALDKKRLDGRAGLVGG
jgi:hypothetical protein